MSEIASPNGSLPARAAGSLPTEDRLSPDEARAVRAIERDTLWHERRLRPHGKGKAE